MDVGSCTVTEEQLVALEPGRCHDQFLEVIWRQGGGIGEATILEPGDSSGAGCVRGVARLVEHILEGKHGEFLEYVIEKGPYPVSYNRARVTFTASGDGTLVTWTSNFTPYFGLGWVLPWVVRTAYRKMLKTLVDSVEAS
ncbi:unnamed protein product [Effrenium voratum]|nr:unnamed protein product [Effrenium voratum]